MRGWKTYKNLDLITCTDKNVAAIMNDRKFYKNTIK